MTGVVFVNEQPNASWMYEEHPWPSVLSREDVSWRTFHQCMTGQKGETGLPMHKPTALVSNEIILLNSVKRFICDGSHEHDRATGEALSRARLWTWPLANAIATAVVKVCKLARSKPYSASYAYPM